MHQARLFEISPFTVVRFSEGQDIPSKTRTLSQMVRGAGSTLKRFTERGARAGAVLAMGLAVSACLGGGEPPMPNAGRTMQTDPARLAGPSGQGIAARSTCLDPNHMTEASPIRVGLLLPLTSSDQAAAKVAKAMRDAASMALFEVDRNELVLVVKDTKGTPEGASAAALEAVEDCVELILGPVFADSVRAAAAAANQMGVAVVAFSSDRQAAAPGSYLLSFQVEEEIRQVVNFALAQGVGSFAGLTSFSQYGDRVFEAFSEEVNAGGGEIRHLVRYQPTTDDFRDPVRKIAEYDQRKSALEQQREALERRSDEVSQRALNRLNDSSTWGTVSYQAVLLADGGTTLRSLAPMLPYFDIDNRTIRFLGTGLWDDPLLWKEDSLQDGWFAAPPPDTRRTFMTVFKNAFGYEPPRIASLAYDAVTLAAALADAPEGQRYTERRLTDPNGFYGIDGIFRFLPDGTAQRGLAILQVKDGGVEVVGPAPTRFETGPDDSFYRPGS